jgi:hypothetical protein
VDCWPNIDEPVDTVTEDDDGCPNGEDVACEELCPKTGVTPEAACPKTDVPVDPWPPKTDTPDDAVECPNTEVLAGGCPKADTPDDTGNCPNTAVVPNDVVVEAEVDNWLKTGGADAADVDPVCVVTVTAVCGTAVVGSWPKVTVPVVVVAVKSGCLNADCPVVWTGADCWPNKLGSDVEATLSAADAVGVVATWLKAALVLVAGAADPDRIGFPNNDKPVREDGSVDTDVTAAVTKGSFRLAASTGSPADTAPS